MAYQTPRARVEGLGSAHSGVEHFWRLRVTAVAMIFLTLWFAYTLLSLAGASRADILAYFHNPIEAVLMVLFVIAACIHMSLGIEEVILDYVENEGMKVLWMLATKAFAWTIASICIFAMYRIAL